MKKMNDFFNIKMELAVKMIYKICKYTLPYTVLPWNHSTVQDKKDVRYNNVYISLLYVITRIRSLKSKGKDRKRKL